MKHLFLFAPRGPFVPQLERCVQILRRRGYAMAYGNGDFWIYGHIVEIELTIKNAGLPLHRAKPSKP